LTPGAVATAGIAAVGKAATPLLVTVVILLTVAVAALLAVLARRSPLATLVGVGILGAVGLVASLAEPVVGPVQTILALLFSLALGTSSAAPSATTAPAAPATSAVNPVLSSILSALDDMSSSLSAELRANLKQPLNLADPEVLDAPVPKGYKGTCRLGLRKVTTGTSTAGQLRQSEPGAVGSPARSPVGRSSPSRRGRKRRAHAETDRAQASSRPGRVRPLQREGVFGRQRSGPGVYPLGKRGGTARAS
jgi:hypothetical protein